MKVDQNPEMYTCGGNKNNFRYPYCYGDFTYATKVNEKAKLIEELLRKIRNIVQKIFNIRTLRFM